MRETIQLAVTIKKKKSKISFIVILNLQTWPILSCRLLEVFLSPYLQWPFRLKGTEKVLSVCWDNRLPKMRELGKFQRWKLWMKWIIVGNKVFGGNLMITFEGRYSKAAHKYATKNTSVPHFRIWKLKWRMNLIFKKLKFSRG